MSRRGSVAAAPANELTAEEYTEPTGTAAAVQGSQRRHGSVMEPGSGAFSSSSLSSLPLPPPVGDEDQEEEQIHQRGSAMGGEQLYPMSREDAERRGRRRSMVLPPAGECSAETERGMSPAEDEWYSQQQRLHGCRFGRSAVVTPPSIRRPAVGETGAADIPGAAGRY